MSRWSTTTAEPAPRIFPPVKEPLLLIHGFTDTAATWAPVAPLLEPHHELLVPTLTGHRGGPPVPPQMTDPLATMADGLERVLDDAGHDKAHLAGNSLGGWLAFELAHRGRALSVVAISPALGWETDEPPDHTRRQFNMAHRAAPFTKRYAKTLARRPGLRKLVFRDLIVHGERVSPRTAYDLMMGSTDVPIFHTFLDHLEAGDYRASWNALDVPTRIAWGARDRTIPLKTCSGWYREALPDAEWVDLPDCGHLAQHDNPELVARTILEVTTARARVA
jgi:pimeloyl-ACP methyl ester carboxylesterase